MAAMCERCSLYRGGDSDFDSSNWAASDLWDFVGHVHEGAVEGTDGSAFLVKSTPEAEPQRQLQPVEPAERAEPGGTRVTLQGFFRSVGQRCQGVVDLVLCSQGQNKCQQRLDFSYSECKLRGAAAAAGAGASAGVGAGAGSGAAAGAAADADALGLCRLNSALELRQPISEVGDCGKLLDIIAAWTAAALKSALDKPIPVVGLNGELLKESGLVPDLSMAKLGASGAVTSFLEQGRERLVQSGFFSDGTLEKELATHVGLFSLTSAVMFIGSIRGLNKHSTAQEGNVVGILATALGIISVLASPGFHGTTRFASTFLVAGLLGYGIAAKVRMEDMPQLIAAFHSGVGLAAVCAGFASFCQPAPFGALKAIETLAGTAVGALTFTGSVVAAGKLHGLIPGSPIILESRWRLNVALTGLSAVLSIAFTNPVLYSSSWGAVLLSGNTLLWGALGALMVLPIGGADMPVVVSLLNACSGLATSAAGFMLSNQLLTITGALVASSGALLSDIMCRGINRSIYNVLLGGFGSDSGAHTAATGAPAGPVSELSAMGFVELLFTAKRVVIVPGYGLAVARCQQRLGEIVALLRRHGVHVHFAIHPVAGRLPGHMNVLLAEADVPYDIIHEMDDVNMTQYDVAIVIGANDIVNPATQTDPTSPIYGMPAIEVWRAKTTVVLKRSMASGYSGVDNPLFSRENVRMLFGDARQSVDTVFHLLQESQERLAGLGEATPSPTSKEELRPSAEDYPVACKTAGVIRERGAGERCVSITPKAVPRLRAMGFSILLEAGAGLLAGFPDEEYVRQGGVQVAESAVEVLKQADVILKVSAPMLEEVQVLQGSQTLVGFWNMHGSQGLLEALGRSMATFVNLSLVPRISRAQKLDALSSMANLAGYRAVLDAFHRLPRFSRSSVTASGVVPPSKVLVIGAGVAGLSAIATAHAMGAKVFANDVREAAREQVESMGAEFVPVDAVGIAGEGAGGYAREMGQAFKEAQLATYARLLPEMDIVICTAMIPNRPAPTLLTKEMLRTMRPGSVVVDLAAQTGGNCEVTRKDAVEVTPEGVMVVGETNYSSSMPGQASEMLANNVLALLETLGGASGFGGEHWDDPVIRAATLTREGQVLWPPAPPPASEPVQVTAPPSEAEATPVPEPLPRMPERTAQVLAWLQEHRTEIALGLGAATVLGLGLATDIPEEELTHLGYFVLSSLIGHFTVAGVTPALHTPLMSVTNAISGIIVVGGMLQLSGPLVSARVACALAAVFLSSVNIVGGFAVTHRMLQMFKQESSS